MISKLLNPLRKLYKYYRYKWYYPHYYRSLCKQPVIKGRVLLLEMRFKTLSNSYQVLYDRLMESERYEVDTAFVRFNFSKGKEYTNNVKTALEKLARAEYVIVDDASLILSSIPLRKETMAINIWHACGAFKKFGRSTANLLFGSSGKELDQYPNYNNLNLVTVSSPEICWAYEEAMNLSPGIVKAVGVSRTDVYYDPAYIESKRENVYRSVPQAKGKKIILYAPTFRGRVSTATAPDEIDFVRFKEELGKDYVLICKHHPFVKEVPVIPEEASDFAFDVSHTLTIEDLICCADLCISDYSSLVFEYSLFEKPMIFYAYDYEEYCDWRGFYYNYFELTPGPIVSNQDELLSAIFAAEKGFDIEKIRSFRDKFMGSCDGKATDRILAEMDVWSHRKAQSHSDNNRK